MKETSIDYVKSDDHIAYYTSDPKYMNRLRKQIEANPKVAICGWDAEAGAWLRINATAVIDDRDEASDVVLNDYPHLRNAYTPGDGNCVVFWLKDATARFCSFGAPEEVFTF